jgi:hypothetical protein
VCESIISTLICMLSDVLKECLCYLVSYTVALTTTLLTYTFFCIDVVTVVRLMAVQYSGGAHGSD